jgi:hypothetical protein
MYRRSTSSCARKVYHLRVTRLCRLAVLCLLAACCVPPVGKTSLPPRLDGVDEPPERGATHAQDARSTASDPAPDPASLPWQTGPQVGYGVAFKDTKNPAGENLFIGYAGCRVSLLLAEAWVEALHEASLAARGVRYLWAVQGPNDRVYANRELGNARVVATLLPLVGEGTHFVLVAGHSSGSFVAHELLARLAGGMDPSGVTAGRVVYFDLDGGADGLTTASVGRLRHAYFVAAHDPTTRTDSPRLAVMRSLGARYASAGGYVQDDVADSMCHEGAQWCVHDTLITTRPHAPTRASAQLDYSEFAGRQASHAWIDAKASEAGLEP